MITDLPLAEDPQDAAPQKEDPPNMEVPHQTNTPFPNEGVMVDGGATPQAEPDKPDVDLWTLPTKPKNLVGAGARIKLGLDGTIKKKNND